MRTSFPATTYSAGVAAKSTAPERARGFIAFLTRQAFGPKFAEVGRDDKGEAAGRRFVSASPQAVLVPSRLGREGAGD